MQALFQTTGVRGISRSFIRNYIDYNIYLFRVNLKETITTAIDLVIFISSMGALFSDWGMILKNISRNWFLIIVFLGSFVKFLYEVYNIIEEIKDYMDLRYGEIFPERIECRDVNISDYDKKWGYEYIECRINHNVSNYVLNSPRIDEYIRNNNLVFKEAKNKEKLIKNFIKAEKDNLLPFLKWQYRNSRFYGKGFFNEKKFCLSKDIIPSGNNTVHCHKGTYYDTFLTNVICGRQLKSNQDNSVIANAEEYFPVNTGKHGEPVLKDITSSVMNNEIGISTLAFTSDHYLVIWTQNRAAQSSNGLLVPTGSGSCDWNDRVADSFNETIINAMKRELWEESGSTNLCKSHTDVGETIILGFFRWIIKGGKPEFVGLTRMHCDLLSLYANKNEVYGGKEYLLTSIDDLENIIDDIMNTGNVSVPLYMNLLCLRRYYAGNREELEKFIFGS